MTPEQRREQYEASKEQLILALYLKWYGIKDIYWRLAPHRHTFPVSLVCDRCHRTLKELMS